MGCGSSTANVKVVPVAAENQVTPNPKQEEPVDREKEQKAIDSRIEYWKDDKVPIAECCYDSTEYFLNKVSGVETINSVIFYSMNTVFIKYYSYRKF